MGRRTCRAAAGCVSVALVGATVLTGCGGSQHAAPAPKARHYVQATGPPIWCPSGGLRTGQRWVQGDQPNIREDVVTTKTSQSFNVRTLVGVSTTQANAIVTEHSCSLRRGISWLLNIERNRVDVRVRDGRIVWARVF